MQGDRRIVLDQPAIVEVTRAQGRPQVPPGLVVPDDGEEGDGRAKRTRIGGTIRRPPGTRSIAVRATTGTGPSLQRRVAWPSR